MTIKTLLFRINEAVDIKIIRSYIYELGREGFKGSINLHSPNILSYGDFNSYYKKIYGWYDSIANLFSKEEEYVETLKANLYSKSFKHNQIEARHFGIKLELFKESLQTQRELLEKDLNILKKFEKSLRESTSGFYHNRKKLKYKETKIQLTGNEGIQELLEIIKDYLKNFYQRSNLYITIENEQIVFHLKYWDITYPLKDIDENIKSRLLELEEDLNIFKNVKAGSK